PTVVVLFARDWHNLGEVPDEQRLPRGIDRDAILPRLDLMPVRSVPDEVIGSLAGVGNDRIGGSRREVAEGALVGGLGEPDELDLGYIDQGAERVKLELGQRSRDVEGRSVGVS